MNKRSVTLIAWASVLTACGGGGGGSSPPPPPPTYGITGTVSGLNGTVVLQRNGANDQSVTSNGVVTLGSGLTASASYTITVLTQPANPAQTCAVTNGTGTLAANVSNVTITCTNVPLLLSATLPINSSNDVARDVAPLLTFSRTLDASTVIPANITLTSAAGAHPITLATSGESATVNHAGKLLPMTEYTVAVSTAVRGSAAEQLANPMSALFVTRDGVWGNAALVETNTVQNASAPQLAFDAAGNAIAVWQQHDGIRLNVWANRYVPGSGWQSPTLMEANADDATSPQVAVNASGAAVVVWEQLTAGFTHIWINQYSPANGWSGAQSLHEAVNSNSIAPVVSIEANGAIHVAHAEQSAAGYHGYAFHYQGGSWTSSTLLGPGTGSASQIRQAVDDAGNVIYLWRHFDGTRFNIYATRRTQNIYSAWAPIETGTGDASEVQVACDASGNAHAVWVQFDGTRNNVLTSRYTVGAGWSAPLLLEAADGGVNVPHVAVSSNGDAYAVWIQDNGTSYEVQGARYTAGAWSLPARVDSIAGNASAPRVAVDASGNAIAVWLQAETLANNLWSNRYIPGSGWGSPALLESSGVSVLNAKTAIGRNGDALTLWTQGTALNVNVSVWSRSFE